MVERARVGMPRPALLRRGESVDPVFWIAFAVSTLFVVAQIAFAAAYVPVMLFAYNKAGLELPWLLQVADALGPLGIIVALALLDALVFAVFGWASKRYWLGLLFVPPLLYLLVAFVLFAAGFSGAEAIFFR